VCAKPLAPIGKGQATTAAAQVKQRAPVQTIVTGFLASQCCRRRWRNMDASKDVATRVFHKAHVRRAKARVQPCSNSSKGKQGQANLATAVTGCCGHYCSTLQEKKTGVSTMATPWPYEAGSTIISVPWAYDAGSPIISSDDIDALCGCKFIMHNLIRVHVTGCTKQDSPEASHHRPRRSGTRDLCFSTCRVRRPGTLVSSVPRTTHAASNKSPAPFTTLSRSTRWHRRVTAVSSGMP